MLDIKKEITNFALELGFDDIGFASPQDPLPYFSDFSKAINENRYGPLDYLAETHKVRTNIRNFFPECNSVLIVIKNYYTGDHKEPENGLMAKIARYAWGRDYHHWFKKNLKKLGNQLECLVPEKTTYRIFNDTAPVLEKAWAQQAGLGFIGKSSLFIHRKYGTWTFIGGIAWSHSLSPNTAYAGPDCGTCTRCMDACPTNALVSPRKLDANLCIATWNIERPRHSSSIQKSPRNTGWGFGCDICQEVCPWNKFQQKTQEQRFNTTEKNTHLTKELLKKDLRGTPLNRARKLGLLLNLLRNPKKT